MHYMSQLAQSSTYQHAMYYFLENHYIKIHSITQTTKKAKFQVLYIEFTVTHCNVIQNAHFCKTSPKIKKLQFLVIIFITKSHY